MIVREDVLSSRKGVHVALDKEVHAGLRGISFKHNVSMQDMLNEFAKLLVAGDKRAVKIVEDLTVRKIKAKIEGVPRIDNSNRPVSVLDHETLYYLIEEDLRKDA